MIKDLVTFEKKHTQLVVRMQESSMMDPMALSRMEKSPGCLDFTFAPNQKGVIVYDCTKLVPLSSFLKKFSFEKEDGYLFMQGLLESLEQVHQSQAVLMDCDAIHLTSYGNGFRFVCLPLSLEYWMSSREDLAHFVESLARSFRTQSAYELKGLLLDWSSKSDLSLRGLLQSIHDLHTSYYPIRRFSFKKRKTQFIAQTPVYEDVSYPEFMMSSDSPVSYDDPVKKPEKREEKPFHPDLYDLDYGLLKIAEPEPAWPKQKESFFEELNGQDEEDLMKTQVLFEKPEHNASLQIDGKQYELCFEEVYVGRHISNEICLNSPQVSSIHARITRNQDGFYVQDLKSTNKTWLSGKPIAAKTKLEDGMHIRFGSVEAIFHE